MEEQESFEEFKAKLEEGASYKDRLKKDLKKEKEKAIEAFQARGRTKSIDPLKEFRRQSNIKRGRGRPRKYKPLKDSDRPVGRPRKKVMNLSGKSVIEFNPDYERRREPFVPPTKEQAILMQMFNDKGSIWGFNNQPVRRYRTLESGYGIIKSGDGGQTRRMFGGR